MGWPQFLPIIRNGKSIGFNETETPEMDRIEGRVSQILSAEIPSVEHRLIAKAMLEVKGINLGPVRHSPQKAKKSRR